MLHIQITKLFLQFSLLLSFSVLLLLHLMLFDHLFMLSLQVLDSELLAYFLHRDIKYKNDVYADQSQTCDYHYSTGEFSSLEIVQEVCKEDEQVTDEHE